MKRISLDVLYNSDKDSVAIFDVVQNNAGEYTAKLYKGPRDAERLIPVLLYNGNTDEWVINVMISILMYKAVNYVDIKSLPGGTNLNIPAWDDILHLPADVDEPLQKQHRKLSI